MRTTYYFGTHAMSDRNYPYLTHLLDLITELSPNWILPYYFGGTLIPTEANSPEEGLYLISKGIQRFPTDWRLWFFKGYYQWKFDKSLIEAAKTLRQASFLPKAPPYLSRLPATLFTKAGQRELAIHFLEESLEQVTDERQRQVLLQKMEEVLREE